MTTIPGTHEAVGHTSPTSGIVSFQVPTEIPNADEVLVRVLYAVATPVDLWHADFNLLDFGYPSVFGVDLVGEIVKVGENADSEFRAGDKIFSFSPDVTKVKAKAFQEYATLSRWSIGKVPHNLTLQETATVPDNLVTVFNTLVTDLALTIPTDFPASRSPPEASTPILVWGGAGGVGSLALQILKLSGFKNVIAVASSRNHALLRTLGATHTVDYSDPDVAEQIEKAAGGKVKYVFDTISDEEYSLKPIAKVVGKGSKVAWLLPARTGGHGGVSGVSNDLTVTFPDGVELIGVRTFEYQKNEYFKKALQSKVIPRLLAEGLVRPSKVREVGGATLVERVTAGFDVLRKGLSGERVVIKVAEA